VEKTLVVARLACGTIGQATPQKAKQNKSRLLLRTWISPNGKIVGILSQNFEIEYAPNCAFR